jgi:uncharacterized protein (TIGR03083 family)
MATMEIAEYISAIQRDGSLLAAAAQRAGLDAVVPSCSPWRVRDLLRHQGYVHRWAAEYVAGQHEEMVPELTEAEQLGAGPDDAGLLGWLQAGWAELVETLRTADPEISCWTFLPAPSPLAFWARRQAHETAIHRVDAELAAGQATPFPADFAADGIDELIMGIFGRGAAGTMPGSFTLGVDAADLNENWVVGNVRSGTKAASVPLGGVSETDCTVTGPASALYLLLWNRATAADGGVAVTGDPDVLRLWQAEMQVRWS